MKKRFAMLAAAAALATVTARASAAVYITEFNSNAGDGNDYEFVEFTNTGNTAVDMTGWSEDDGTRSPNKSQHSLSGFGTLAPGQSAIFTEASPDAFRTYWWGSVAAAPADLKIVGPYTNDNLSSSGDEVNLFDNTGSLADRLTYNGSGTAPFGGGSASGVTRNGPLSALGANSNFDWANSFVGDAYGSFAAAGNTSLIGNPGSYSPVPEPASLGLLLIGGSMFLTGRRRRRI
jgi:hypothetical protein